MPLRYISIWEELWSWWRREKVLNTELLNSDFFPQWVKGFFTVHFRLCLHWLKPKDVSEEAWISGYNQNELSSFLLSQFLKAHSKTEAISWVFYSSFCLQMDTWCLHFGCLLLVEKLLLLFYCLLVSSINTSGNMRGKGIKKEKQVHCFDFPCW